MTQAVNFSTRNGVAIIEINHPPLNALSYLVRQDILQGLERAQQDAEISAVVLAGAGKTFTAGSDIRDTEDPAQRPSLAELCDAIEASEIPVVACLHGSVLGSGYELALAAHGRLASDGTRIGLPEIDLGLIPGAGATQRLPRIVEIKDALRLLLSGRLVNVSNERSTGFVDGVVDGDLTAAGVAHALELAANSPVPTKSRRERFGHLSAYADAIEAARKGLPKANRGAAKAILECVEAAPLLPIEAGLALEAEHAAQQRESHASQSLRHVFLSSHQTHAATAGLPSPSKIASVALFGSGLPVAGVAVACLDAGRHVSITTANDASAKFVRARVSAIYGDAIARGRLRSEVRQERLSRLHVQSTEVAASPADLVLHIDVAEQELEAKTLESINKAARPDGVIAFDDPYADISELGNQLGRPHQVLAIHFNRPSHINKLVEIGVGRETSQATEATAFAFLRDLRKTSIRCKAVPGLIGDKVLSGCLRAADTLLADGADPYELDAQFVRLGFAKGPLRIMDDQGFQALLGRLGPDTMPVLADLSKSGRVGRAKLLGFYRYDEDGRAIQDPTLVVDIQKAREMMDVDANTVTTDEISSRCLLAMTNVAAKLLDTGAVETAADIDVAVTLGQGFPREMGGPLKASEHRGLLSDLRKLEALARADTFWTPAHALREAVKNGGRFSTKASSLAKK